MDEAILKAAKKAAASARSIMKEGDIPADEQSVVRLGIRDAIRKLVDSSDITVLWDNDHYDSAVGCGIGAAQEAFIQSNGGRGRKMFGIEQEEAERSFDEFMKTGAVETLPKFMQFLRESEERNPTVSVFRRLERLRKGQYCGDVKVQDVDYFAYDDRSRLQDLDTVQVKGDIASEVHQRLVEDRNVLMRDKIHARMRSHAYDKVMICVGAAHAAINGDGDKHRDLDELLEADDVCKMRYNVKSISITHRSDCAPGIFKNRASPLRQSDGITYLPSRDIPDLWVNYLPNMTPEQFDDRVQSVPLEAREDIVALLHPWQRLYSETRERLQDAADNRLEAALAASGGHVPGLRFRNDLNSMIDSANAWDFGAAESQLKSIRKRYGNLQGVQEEHAKYLQENGSPLSTASTDAEVFAKQSEGMLRDTEELLCRVRARLNEGQPMQTAVRQVEPTMPKPVLPQR